MSHTNSADSAATELIFVPIGTEAAWHLFHYSGMYGLSEEHCESVCSMLKRYGKRYRTDRVKHCTLLRSAGIQGTGQDDAFIQLCWARFFGGAHKLAFNHANAKGAKKRRPLGKGSRTVDRLLTKSVGEQLWTKRDLRLVASKIEGDPVGWQAWLQKHQTESTNEYK